MIHSLKELKELLHKKSQTPELIKNEQICQLAYDVKKQILSHFEGRELNYVWESSQDLAKTALLSKIIQHTFYKDLTPQEAFSYFKELNSYEKLLVTQIEIQKKIQKQIKKAA